MLDRIANTGNIRAVLLIIAVFFVLGLVSKSSPPIKKTKNGARTIYTDRREPGMVYVYIEVKGKFIKYRENHLGSGYLVTYWIFEKDEKPKRDPPKDVIVLHRPNDHIDALEKDLDEVKAAYSKQRWWERVWR